MKKEGWPDFPFNTWSVEKWDMSSLQSLASWLEQHSERYRDGSGFLGETTPMEKQIIEHLILLQQRVGALRDVAQASLQIIDDNRPSQRARRVLHWIAERIAHTKQKLQESTLYWLLGFLGVLLLVYGFLKYVLHFFGK